LPSTPPPPPFQGNQADFGAYVLENNIRIN
jgi:hypothetical protein